MRTHVNRTFAALERRTERILAVLRLLALLVLSVVFWFIGTLESRNAAMVPLGSFAMITLVGLVAARRGLFRPWVPWLLTTLDVIVLIHCLVMLAMATGQLLYPALETLPASLIYVFLATAAVRHRPLLILYTGGLFIALWIAILSLAPLVGFGSWTSEMLTTALGRLAVVGLVSYALFVAVTRAQRTLTGSIIEARLRANLSRYFSPQVVDEIANTGSAARSFRSQKAAILFADLRGFTSLSETMPADRVADFLNEYRRRITEPIVEHHGTIDKFIGDGVMVIFGVPEPRADDARNAVLGGLAVVSAIKSWSDERRTEGLPPLEIGVGIHYGDVIAGTLGDEHRLEYTAIGDTVNTAARIEQLTADLGMPLLVSADVLAAAPDLEGSLQSMPLPPRSLRGRSQPIHLYRLESKAEPVMQVEESERLRVSTLANAH